MLSKKVSLVAALSCVLGGSVFADREEVRLEIDQVHIPNGWDSNDKDIQVVITGELPNTCYRRPYGDAKVVDKEIYIDVKATKIEDKEAVCIQAIVPYMVSVPVGQLREGAYHVEVNPGSVLGKEAVLSVEHPSTNSIDNYTYANVTNIKHAPNSRVVTLEGYHPSSCMSIDRVDIIANETNDTYSVLPIVKQVKPVCDRMIQPFSYDVDLPATTSSTSEVVVHVRKIDGNGENYLIRTNGQK